MITPILETNRLHLRPLEKSDAQAVYTCWESDPAVAKYMFWSSHQDIHKTEAWVAFELLQIPSNTWYRWVAIDKDSNKLIGTGLVYFDEDYQMFEIGYNFGKDFWGKGYATEMMKAILQYCKVIGIKELVGRFAKENSGSKRVMEKLGFVYCKDIPYEANDGQHVYEGEEYRCFL